MFNVKTYNAISPAGIHKFTKDFTVNQNQAPDAYMIRSIDLHDHQFPASLKIIARCGAGFNNIPLKRASEAGIAVFNTPGGNSNAVKELVIAMMIATQRNLIKAAEWSAQAAAGADITLRTEKQKTQFNGTELTGKRLAVIGLGHVGSLVANAGVDLGMDVIGYDPYLSSDAAWNIYRTVKRAPTIADAVRDADFVTVHVPKNDETTGLIGTPEIKLMHDDAVLLNYSRLGIVDNLATVKALAAHHLRHYCTDFSEAQILHHDAITITPHIGGSTKEAEAGCSLVAAHEIMRFLKTGDTTNSVNLPNVNVPFASPYRLTMIHRNIPNMLGQITGAIAHENLNIENLVNRARGDFAYTIVDLTDFETAKRDQIITNLEKIPAVSRVRLLQP